MLPQKNLEFRPKDSITFIVATETPDHYVIVIARGQGFMAVNRSESEGKARGQGQFTLP